MYKELVMTIRDCASRNRIDGRNLTASTLDQAADAIEKLSKPKWVPVTERLPEMFVSVQAHMTDAGPFPSVLEAYRISDDEWFFPALREVHPVNYWMPLGSNTPLPEGPKEGKDADN